MLENGLVETAQTIAEEATVEEFVLLWIEYIREVGYVEYDKPNSDLGCTSTLHRAFGSPGKFNEEELRDAIEYLHDRGQLSMRQFEVQGSKIVGNKGKEYPQKYRVFVTR